MKERRPSTRVIVRYVLIQVPGAVVFILVLFMLHRWVNLPPWLLWTIAVIIIAKDIFMFPLVRRSYDKSDACPDNSMRGAHGTVTERLSPSGYVRVRGELWRAEVMDGEPSADKGTRVTVLGSQGLTLLVRPEDRGGPAS